MAEEKKGFFNHLVTGLKKTCKVVIYGLDDLSNESREVDNDSCNELEEILITDDMGVRATEEVPEKLCAMTEERRMQARSVCRNLLIEGIRSRVDLGEDTYDFKKAPSVLLLIGVNGTGKTATAGEMAAQVKANDRHVLLADTDTFHAATIEQLEVWPQHAGVEMVKATAGANPATVVFDACQVSRTRRTDLLICDAAGRFHNKKNLMEELQKIDRVVQRELPECRGETLLVLDGTMGQDAIKRAKEFGDICGTSGVALTKLDGSAKGDVVITIQAELKLPVKHISASKRTGDPRKFDAGQYVKALFTREPDRESEEET